jgi:hypothetical protein
MTTRLARALLLLGCGLQACGARSGLEVGAFGGGASACSDGDTEPCGTAEGACELGVATCQDGVFGACEGGVTPTEEVCNGLDENCDGAIDEPFGVGQPCDGPDSDLCEDDVRSCDGCSAGDSNVRYSS